jgi:alginate O-acetyltransferase complex protein AlgI
VGRARNLIDYLLYVAFFPQLIAGPILRYHDICDQIVKRDHTVDSAFVGMCRFCLGLGKKVLIADNVGKIADRAFSFAPQDLTCGYAWLGILGYAFQIYFDFSAYSDMAIGLARMMGFRFLENFNMPYTSQTITEFWRRWHISLSNWMREYLYFPLGGNRYGAARTYLNLVTVFFISGLWHGASWTFVAWGLYHGCFLIIDRLFWKCVAERLPKFVNVLLTFFFVLIGWVLFRSTSFGQAQSYLRLLFQWSTLCVPLPRHFSAAIIDNREWTMMAIAAVLCFVPASSSVLEKLKALWFALGERPRLLLQGAGAFALFFASVVTISGSSFSPFLYFEF